MIDTTAPTHGLPPCLRIPIAATSVAAVEHYVGVVLQVVAGRDGRPNALCVHTADLAPRMHPGVKLWREPKATGYLAALHPLRQVWVHVDYAGYRAAYMGFGMPPIPPGHVLDHVQNRRAVRLRAHSHPYLRLCPVSRQVNSSGGSDYGGEGMEKRYLRGLPFGARVTSGQIVYADPMDITKMLGLPPGTFELQGVVDVQRLLFPT